MSKNTHKKIQIGAFLLIGVVILTTCNNLAITEVPLSDTAPTPTGAETITAISTPLPTPTAIEEPLTIFLSNALPGDIINRQTLEDIIISDHPDASLWFGPVEEALNGTNHKTATWIYALAAPFPTLKDDITLTELQAYWLGNNDHNLISVSNIYVPETLIPILDARWGNHASSNITTFKDVPAPDLLWDENAWVILPFEKINPKLKIISVNELSPLFKDFKPEAYPLTVHYSLVQNANSTHEITEAEQLMLSSSIQTTNRDPDKMTTLVMTGVTALVRATAYRMEIYGVQYPGEMIVHWLSEADLTHISNEISFYEDCPFPDPFNSSLHFCSDPKYIELLEFVGADIIELTGNHNNDMQYIKGVDTVPFTIELYEERGMAYFGGGLNLADAKSPLLVTHNGNQLAFIGCNAPGPIYAWATEDQGGAAPCGDYQWMVNEISDLKAAGYLPIATFQHHEDYYTHAGHHLVRDFGLMAEAGAVIVNGSQAHHPKAMAFVYDAFIDYGLGNLFFDQMGYTDMYGNHTVKVRWEIIQRHTFYDGRHLSTELLTAMLEDYAQPRPMTLIERRIFLDELFTASGWISR